VTTTVTAADVEALLRELVAIESVSGTPGEEAVLERLAGWLRERGVPEASVLRAGSYPSLVARTVAGATGDLLVLGHADTVPPAGGTDGVRAHEEPGWVRGRGASDMKGGLAAAAAALVRAARERLPMSLVVTCSEELGCLGAPAVLDQVRAIAPRAVVVPESTGNRVACGHRGAVWLKVTTRGRAAHGSQPERGTNAVLAMAEVLRRLDEVPLRSHPDLGTETVSVGTVSGGSATNVVPDECCATLDVRVVADDAAPVVAWLLGQAGVESVVELLRLPAVWTDPAHRWVEELGEPAVPPAVPYFTDACVVAPALGDGVPLVVCGPGDPALVHGADERVGLVAVLKSVEVLLRAARSA